MSSKNTLARIAAMLAASLIFGHPNAQAALGGLSSSLQADALTMNGSVQSQTVVTGFTRYTISLTAGGQAVEYADSGGLVFAVAWNTPVLPDMSVLLGSYGARLSSAQGERQRQRVQGTSAGGGRRHFAANSSDLVIESHGHMRGYYGLAYLPAKLPTGVTAAQLQ